MGIDVDRRGLVGATGDKLQHFGACSNGGVGVRARDHCRDRLLPPPNLRTELSFVAVPPVRRP